MKTIIYTLIIILNLNSLFAQSEKIPLEKRKGHLYSEWKLNNTITAKIFLESGFPIIIFNEQFLQKHLNELALKLEIPSEDEFVSTWNNAKKTKIKYHINDTLIINRLPQIINAVVIDFSEIPSWKDYDIVYPIADLKGIIEINIKEKYMRILDTLNYIKNFNVYKMKIDENTKGLYLNTELSVYDTLGGKEMIKGDFLFDLGAGNAFMLNKNLKKVQVFVEKSDRMILKDTTRINTKGKKELSIIIPDNIVLNNIRIQNSYVVAMKYNSTKASDKYIGLIGTSFFKEFITIFDYDNKKLYLKSNSKNIKIIKG